MTALPKHAAFDSIYRPDFEVLEERHGKVSLYPHTEQLPLLLRALNLEFYTPLADRIARVDKRADGFHKVMLKRAVSAFCNTFNKSRPDRLQLFELHDADLVAKVTLVQHITEDRPLGRVHRFRFYGKDGFLPDIHLSGRRLSFSDHVLERFSSRVPNQVGEDLWRFLLVFYGCTFISMPVGKGRAFILPFYDSILAFTYTESEDEFFVTTCLTMNEINSLELELPSQTLNLHYGKDFVRPRIRNWFPPGEAIKLHEIWKRKIQPPPATPEPNNFRNWKHLAQWIKDGTVTGGHGPGSRLVFVDDIPGPMVMEAKPGQKELVFDELKFFKEKYPQYDWEATFAEQDALKSRPLKQLAKKNPRSSAQSA